MNEITDLNTKYVDTVNDIVKVISEKSIPYYMLDEILFSVKSIIDATLIS